MKRKTGVVIGIAWGLAGLILVGCGGEAEVPAEESSVEETTVEEIIETEQEPTEAAPTDTPEPTETPIPTATSIPLTLELSNDEPRFVSDHIVVDEVGLPEPGWLVVWPDNNDVLDPADALAFVEVDPGSQEQISIPLDATDWAIGSVQIALHTGRTGTELTADGSNLALIQTVEIETPATQPMIESQTSVVSDDGFLRVDYVRSPGPAWLAVYDQTKENLLGFRGVSAGETNDVDIPLQWYNSTTTVHLFLLADLGNEGEFEDSIDEVVEVNGQPLTVEFELGLPAEIVIIDQPMVGNVVIERITSPTDGYVAVFGDQDEDGFPNTIIGSAPINKGLNEYVEVEIDTTAVSAQMIVSIFFDSDGDGAFDYFEDEPILYAPPGENLAPLFVPVRTDIEGALLVDHTSTAEMLVIDWAVIPLDGWVVVEKLPAQQPAEAVGQEKLDVGLHHNLEVPLTGVRSGDTVRVMLYGNNPDLDLFEPDRNDYPLQADGRLVFVEFVVK